MWASKLTVCPYTVRAPVWPQSRAHGWHLELKDLSQEVLPLWSTEKWCGGRKAGQWQTDRNDAAEKKVEEQRGEEVDSWVLWGSEKWGEIGWTSLTKGAQNILLSLSCSFPIYLFMPPSQSFLASYLSYDVKYKLDEPARKATTVQSRWGCI